VKLAGRVALVTGASRGLGRAIALELAREGADVAVLARSELPGKLPGTIHDTAREIEALGRRALPLRCDVTRDEDLRACAERAVAELGRVDVLVNNAGIIVNRPFLETDPRRLDLLYRVNVRAPFVAMQALVPHMIERGSGHVINVATLSSQARGTRVPLGYAGYTGTKAALVRMSLAIALELRPHGVSVNALAPTGLVETEGWKAVAGGARLPNAEPIEYVGRAAAWIASQDPGRLTARFLETQQLLAGAGLIPSASLSYADLPQVDARSFEADG
jgi:NAD(P)-dependent dehydrogenase (short-subunit alcohol dehydrogenase family)